MSSKSRNYFGENTEEWNWKDFESTEGFPISENLLDWVIGQEGAMSECKLCLDEWMHKLKGLKERKWWRFWDKPESEKPSAKNQLSPAPSLFLLGDAGTGKSLIGRALASHLTFLYKKYKIQLYDVVCWKNDVIPSEPKISIKQSSEGRELVRKLLMKEQRKGFWKKWGFRLLQGLMIGFGVLIVGFILYHLISNWLFPTSNLYYTSYGQAFYPTVPEDFKGTVYEWVKGLSEPLFTFGEYWANNGGFVSYILNGLVSNAQLLYLGIGSLSMGAMIFIFKNVWGMMGGNKKGIGGSISANSPKLIVDNSDGKAPFIDATGHGSSQLFGSIAWDPYQTGGLGTPEHQRVSAGEVHRAFMGILYIDEIKNLNQKEAVTLLTVLEDGQLPITLRSSGAIGGDSITGNTVIFFRENGKTLRYGQFTELIESFEEGNQIEVLSPKIMDFHCEDLEWTPVLKVFRRGLKTIKELTLIGGKRIKLTKDHSLFRCNHLQNKNTLVPTEVKEDGKYITVEKYSLPPFDVLNLTNEDVEFLGFWTGDGMFERDRTIGLACGNSEDDKQFIINYAKRYGVKATPHGMRGDMRIHSVEMVRKMKAYGFISGSINKRIPEWMFFLPKEKIKSFLRGYLRSDGSYYKKDIRNILQFSSVNRKLLEDFQTLLNCIGIPSSISEGRMNGQKAFKSNNPQFKLTIWRDSSENFNVAFKRPQNVLSLHRVRKLVDCGEEEVFDISTKNECFIANGILCHNTAAMSVATEPVPCLSFLVAAGNFDSIPHIHSALMDRIAGYGKVVRMNNEMPNNVENRRKYVQFISQEIKRFDLLPFSRDACIDIISEGRRKSGFRNKLTTRFRPMISVIKTASTLAMNEYEELGEKQKNIDEIKLAIDDFKEKGINITFDEAVNSCSGFINGIVEAKHIKEAIDKHCKTIHMQLLEYWINRGRPFVYVDPKAKPRVGQIAGLAVRSFADDDVGEVGILKASMCKISKNMVGKTESYFNVSGVAKPDKSEWIHDSIAKVRHVIIEKYGIDPAIDYKTMIDFQQESRVDGPSAGITMTLALMSVLDKKKIRQDIAVTGEITIDCEGKYVITPIGGVDAKIRAAEYWGYKKVVIPMRNFKNSIDPKDYKIEVVGCETLEDYMRELFVEEVK